MEKSATLSPDGVYRYTLERVWAPSLPRVVWVMLNPSTADAEQDDPTIRRCVGFAKAWGYGGIVVVNLFAYRTKSPAVLAEMRGARVDVVGPGNLSAVEGVLGRPENSLVMLAWGASKMAETSDAWRVRASVWSLANDKVSCLGVTKARAPRHPLYVRGSAYPIPAGPVMSLRESWLSD